MPVVNEQRNLATALPRIAGVISDFREPNVIRAAPTPLYNTYQDVWTFADVLSRS